MKRFNSIDILRAIAIVLMVTCHFVLFLSSPEGAYPGMYVFADYVLGGSPAAMFLFLAGVSLLLSIQASRARQLSEAAIVGRGLVRGVVLFIFGIILQVIVWGSDCLWDWDVLTAIASCLLLLVLMRNLKAAHLIIIAAIAGLLAPYLRHVFGYPAYWEPVDEYVAPWTVREIFGGFLLNGYFPLLPWGSYALFGAGLSKLIFGEPDPARQSRTGKWLLICGTLLLVIGGGGMLIAPWAQPTGFAALYVSAATFYPLANTLYLLNLGIVLLLFWGLHIWFDHREITHPVMDFCRRYSRYALTIYALHHVILVLIPRIIGIWRYQDGYHYYQSLTEAPMGLGLSVIFMLGLYPVLILWDKYHGVLSVEWLLNHYIPKSGKNA
jgi:uncharacterized membrane protein